MTISKRNREQPTCGRFEYVNLNGEPLGPGEGKTVEVEGVSLALFNVDGTFFAIANDCTHVGGPLGQGALIGNEVTCPLHGAQFDVTCGKALSGPARGDVKSFPVSLEGNDVLVELE